MSYCVMCDADSEFTKLDEEIERLKQERDSGREAIFDAMKEILAKKSERDEARAIVRDLLAFPDRLETEERARAAVAKWEKET